MTFAIIILTAMGVALGFALSAAARVLRVEVEPLVNDIYALLPGSQCGQ